MPEKRREDKRDLRYLAQRAYRMMLADLTAGEQEFERLLRIYPYAGQLYLERAEAYRHLGQSAMARDDYEQAVDLIPPSSMQERARAGFEVCELASRANTRHANKDHRSNGNLTLESGAFLLEKYVLERPLSTSSMAQVWLAHEPAQHNRLVAIKVPRDDLAPAQTAEMAARYAREIQVCTELEQANTPNIVRALTTEKLDGRRLLVLEYMPGASLADRLENLERPLPARQTVKIIRPILVALQAAHSHKLRIVHRDVKPSNILFGANDDAHLGDFGLAQFGRASEVGSSPGMWHAGTPLYMAPEQTHHDNYITPAADIYAVGTVLYEMLTLKCYKEQPPDTCIANLVPDVPQPLVQIVDWCLHKDPWQRPNSAQELVQKLDAIHLSNLPIALRKEPKVTEENRLPQNQDESQTFDTGDLDAETFESLPELADTAQPDDPATAESSGKDSDAYSSETGDPLGTAVWEPLSSTRSKSPSWRWIGTVVLIVILGFLALWETDLLSWAGLHSPFAQPKATLAPTRIAVVIPTPVPTFTPQVAPTATQVVPTRTPVPASTATSLPTSTKEPTPTEEPTPLPGPTVVYGIPVGGKAIVTGTLGRGVNLHSAPGIAAPINFAEEEGKFVTLLEGPVYTDGYAWVNVELERGGTGWIAARFIAAEITS